MIMLARYRKQNDGFEQLMVLLETSADKKKEQLLTLIEQEDASWAKMLRVQMLSEEKIFSWEQELLCEVTSVVSAKVLAACLKRCPENFEKATATFPHAHKKEVEIEMEAKIGEGESQAAMIRLIQTARKMHKEGRIVIPGEKSTEEYVA